MLCEDLFGLAIAHDLSVRHLEALEGTQGALCLELLQEADKDVEEDDKRQHRCWDPLLQPQLDNRNDDEDDDHEVGELEEQGLEHAGRGRARECVDAVACPARSRLLLGQALGGLCAEEVEDLGDGLFVVLAWGWEARLCRGQHCGGGGCARLHQQLRQAAQHLVVHTRLHVQPPVRKLEEVGGDDVDEAVDGAAVVLGALADVAVELELVRQRIDRELLEGVCKGLIARAEEEGEHPQGSLGLGAQLGVDLAVGLFAGLAQQKVEQRLCRPFVQLLLRPLVVPLQFL